MKQTSWAPIIGVTWVALGGMQFLSGVWATLVSIAMLGMSLLPQLRDTPTTFRAFFICAPFAGVIQCTLSGLVVYSGLRLAQLREHAARLLQVVCWLMIAFLWCCVLGFVVLGFTTGGHARDDTGVIRWVLLGVPVLIGIGLSFPPLVTIKMVGAMDESTGRPSTVELAPQS